MGVTCPQSSYTSTCMDLENSHHEAPTGRQTPQLLSKTHSRMARAASVLDRETSIEQGGAYTTQPSTETFMCGVFTENLRGTRGTVLKPTANSGPRVGLSHTQEQ